MSVSFRKHKYQHELAELEQEFSDRLSLNQKPIGTPLTHKKTEYTKWRHYKSHVLVMAGLGAGTALLVAGFNSANKRSFEDIYYASW